MNTTSIFHIALLCIACLLASCTTGTEPTRIQMQTNTSPKSGSSFTFMSGTIDSSGHYTEIYPFRQVMTQTGLTRAGKSSVATVVVGFPGTSGGTPGLHSDSLIFSYEPNGDISILLNDTTMADGRFMYTTGRIVWLPLPCSSDNPVTLPGIDTVFTTPSGPDEHFTMSQSVTYIGEENVTVGTETLLCKKVRWHYQSHDTFMPAYDFTYTFWIAPKIGYIARVQFSSAFSKKISDYSLKSYTLK